MPSIVCIENNSFYKITININSVYRLLNDDFGNCNNAVSCLDCLVFCDINLPHLNPGSERPFGGLREKYGDIFTINTATKTVVVNTASLARETRLGRNKDNVLGVAPETVYPLTIMLGDDVGFADYGTPYLFRKRVFNAAMHVFGEDISRAEEKGGYAVKSTLEKINSMVSRENPTGKP